MKKNRVKTIVRTTVLVLISIAIGINVYVFNASRVAGNAVPMPFGIGATVVLSGSMEPELSTGDLLIIAERDSYDVDDVVVFQDGRMAVVHRIVSIDGDSVVTRGDANNVDDAPISREQIKGIVVLAIPYAGFVVNMIKTPIGTIVLLAAALWLLEGSFGREKKADDEAIEHIRAEIERMKKEQENKTL